jgi:hypothetical protein
MGIARPGIDAVAQPLPVVLGRGRNSVSVLAPPDLVRGLKASKSFPDLRQARICVHRRVDRRCNVFGGAVNTAHVLEKTDRLCNGLGQRMIDLF